jgi:ABC-type sugar transport system substrate-binding protein
MTPTEKRTLHLFLLTDQNAFQRAQASAAERAAQSRDLEIQVYYAESHGVIQVEQLFASIFAKRGPKPDAILVETMAADGMPRVARNAVQAGIGWGVINCAPEYTSQLRSSHPELPIFSVGVDNGRVGEIQGAQLARLLTSKHAPSVLCVRGPAESPAARARTKGLRAVLASHDITLASVDTDWTSAGAKSVVTEWLRFHDKNIAAVVAQNDEIAEGALAAFPEASATDVRIPFIGCDGLPAGGQALVRSGVLAATVVTPLPGVGAFADFFSQGTMPEEQIVITPQSFPRVEEILIL